MSRIVCDMNKCSGCLACVVACIDQHYDETAENPVSCRIHEKKQSAKGAVCFQTRSCLHCEDASCIHACPAGALIRDDNGFVVPLREKCTGCQACAKACPHDVPRFDEDGKLVKCDGCTTRISCGLEPACVRTCHTGCLKLVRE